MQLTNLNSGGGRYVTINPSNKLVTYKDGAFYNLEQGLGAASAGPSSEDAAELILGMAPYLWTAPESGDTVLKPHSGSVPKIDSVLRMDDGTADIAVGSLETLISLLILTTQKLDERLSKLEGGGG